MYRLPLAAVAVLAALFATACSAATAPGAAAPTTASAPATSTAPASPAPASPAPASPAPASQAPAPPPTAPAITASWAAIELVDARSGETFRIADLAGRTVFIEPMAIWCSSCRRLQGEAKVALARLDREQVLYLSLDVDPSEDTAQLARYADQLGFDWLFAVAPTSLALALAEQFGDQVLNPPSTPLILIRPDGSVELIGFGHRSADELVAIAGA
ncbi:MAG: hypothetical protein FJ038_10550 [Chloroflexi bacterium]|nr:hypothetical protein [Chloroflexota bacterium]